MSLSESNELIRNKQLGPMLSQSFTVEFRILWWKKLLEKYGVNEIEMYFKKNPIFKILQNFVKFIVFLIQTIKKWPSQETFVYLYFQYFMKRLRPAHVWVQLYILYQQNVQYYCLWILPLLFKYSVGVESTSLM